MRTNINIHCRNEPVPMDFSVERCGETMGDPYFCVEIEIAGTEVGIFLSPEQYEEFREKTLHALRACPVQGGA